MDDNLKRRKFLSRMLAYVTGGLIFGIPNASADNLIDISRKAGINRTEFDEMVLIPAGIFLMGTTTEQAKKLADKYGYHVSWLSGEIPQQELNLPDYWIDKYPVTNAQFYNFCTATGYTGPRHWKDSRPPDEILNHPVCNVNQIDAMAYAKWAGKRLPTEAEWEKAARGTDGRLFPWGNVFDPTACCWNRSGADELTTDPVNAHPAGASPYGVMDMTGNLFEWCGDGPSGNNAYRPVRNTAYIKGGSWITTEILDLRPAACGFSGARNNAISFIGFRCVKEVN